MKQVDVAHKVETASVSERVVNLRVNLCCQYTITESRKGEFVISQQGMKTDYHCLCTLTTDNGEWRYGSEKNTDVEGVKNTE